MTLRIRHRSANLCSGAVRDACVSRQSLLHFVSRRSHIFWPNSCTRGASVFWLRNDVSRGKFDSKARLRCVGARDRTRLGLQHYLHTALAFDHISLYRTRRFMSLDIALGGRDASAASLTPGQKLRVHTVWGISSGSSTPGGVALIHRPENVAWSAAFDPAQARIDQTY